jgi:oligoendopeptidase F
MITDSAHVDKAVDTFANKWKPQVHSLVEVSCLKNALDDYEALMRHFGTSGKEGFYFWLRTKQDQNDPKLKAKSNKVEERSRNNEIKLEFFTLYLSKIDIAHQKKLLNAKELKEYHHLLEQLFAAGQHKLSEEGEKIMTMKGQTSYDNWVKMVSSSLSKEEREIIIKGKKVKKNFSELASELSNTDKKTRDGAAKALNDILISKREIAEAELNSVLANRKVNDEIRKYTRPDASRHLSDDMDSKVVDTLLNAVEKRFKISQDFYKLKAKLLGATKLAYHERNVPYEMKEQEYSFEKACNLIDGVFTRLDPQFGEIFRRFIENGRVDAFPKKGKRGGAFCVWWDPELPTYILLNHNNKLTEVSTIAHEFGHAINAELSKKAQNALNFSTPTSTTEVASTFMEDFVFQEMLKEGTDEDRLGLMMAKLNDDVSTILRQVACYRLEEQLHREYRNKGYLSAEEIGTIFHKNMAAYMGSAVEQSPGSENWWIYWSHIRNYFYVYSYASGLLISKALQRETAKNPQFISNVKEFLSAGGSQSPQQIFSRLGIDITKETFWNEGLDEIERLLKDTEKLARKLGKIK